MVYSSLGLFKSYKLTPLSPPLLRGKQEKLAPSPNLRGGLGRGLSNFCKRSIADCLTL
jgi:hypothetical protein